MLQGPSHKILIVDDDEFSLRLMEKYLVPAGYQVAKARDGVQALELLTHEVFDLLITDIRMPRIGGVRLLEELRRRRRKPIPAIVATASDIDSDVQRSSLAAGALIFMVKPLDRDELLGAVERAIGKVEG